MGQEITTTILKPSIMRLGRGLTQHWGHAKARLKMVYEDRKRYFVQHLWQNLL